MIDFDEYWRAIRAEVSAADQDWERIGRNQMVHAHGRAWRVDWIRLSSVSETLIHAWYAIPADHAAAGHGVLWLPGYSYGTSPPDVNALTPGACVMGVNVHGNPPDWPYENPTGKHDYITDGLSDPGRYIYRRIAGHCLRALEVLAAQAEVDDKKLVAAGMSQGGMLALIVAAQSAGAIRACFADMPFLCDVEYGLEHVRGGAYRVLRGFEPASQPSPEREGSRIERGPGAFPPGSDRDWSRPHRVEPQVGLEAHTLPAALLRRVAASAHGRGPRRGAILSTLKLFDPVSHAPLITAPTWLSAGGRDPSVKPVTVEAVFANLGSRFKEYRLLPDTGHEFVPEMAQTRARWLENWDEIQHAGGIVTGQAKGAQRGKAAPVAELTRRDYDQIGEMH